MKKNINRILLAAFIMAIGLGLKAQEKKYVIAIHGGAGDIKRENISPDKEKAYLLKLEEALELGNIMLKDGARGVDVVIKVIQILEESPLFNAGRGAVFTNKGTIELDASIMNGQDLKAGAVAGVSDVKSPIELAYRVMSNSPHVMLSGKGASEFAKKQGLTMVKNKYFHTEERFRGLQRAKENEKKKIEAQKEKHGTVGCVVLDTYGNLSAGTSTGGMTNKRYGRIGDAPVIGAGNYANNETCAVSCTGHGEFFIRYVVAYNISALMEYKNLGLDEAANYMVNQKLKQAGGTGGLISVDKHGNVSMPFNTDGMFRGYLKSNGEKKVAIFKD
jgi:L-asparaginase / beta-aspartyl-peptidase